MIPRAHLLFSLALLSACRLEPSVGSDCSACPDGFRCIDDRCVNNSLPVLSPLQTLEVVVGDRASYTAAATDPDGDSLSYVWVQVEDGAPRIFTEPQEGPELAFETSEPGSFVFELTVSDGVESTAPASLTVVVTNAKPTVAQLERQFVLPNHTVVLDADPIDADPKHLVTVVWEQLSGEPLALEIDEGVLTVTPTSYGRYRFSATPHDGYESGQPGIYDVIVEPVSGAVYVSASFVPSDNLGSDELCGSIVAPCSDLEEALAVAAPGGAVMVAAQPGGGAYAACLNLQEGSTIIGGFDPETWQVTAAARSQTRVDCPEPTGHVATGDVHLENLTLTNSGERRHWRRSPRELNADQLGGEHRGGARPHPTGRRRTSDPDQCRRLRPGLRTGLFILRGGLRGHPRPAVRGRDLGG